MTTALTEGKWILEYTNRSSRQLYYDQCQALDVPVNEVIFHKLNAEAGDFNAYQLEVPMQQLLGHRGVLALLEVLKVNQGLTRIGLAGQGVNDHVLELLCPLLHQHERLHVLDLRGNPEITEASRDILAKLVKTNSAITDVMLEGTSISRMAQRALSKLALANKNASTIFLTGDYVAFKKLFELLDTNRSGAVSMLDAFTRTDHLEIFAAVEQRFAIMDTSGDAKLQIDEFLNFLHPNFFAMKDRLTAFLAVKDDSESNIVANWKTIREAARRSLVECPSFHLARVNHKVLSLDEATLLIREAMVHEHKRSGSTPDIESLKPPRPDLCDGSHFDHTLVEANGAAGEAGEKRAKALMDMYTTIQARSMFYAVRSLFGRAEDEYWLACQQRWSPVYNIRVSPALARHCHAAFTKIVNEDPELARARYRDTRAAEVTLTRLLDAPIESRVWTLNSIGLRQSLEKEGLDLTLFVTFAEWFTLLNDRFDTAFETSAANIVLSSPVSSPRK